METPPPYRKPSSGQQADNVIKMTKPKLIVLLVACMLAGALVGFGVTVNVLTRPLREFYAGQAQQLWEMQFREPDRNLYDSEPDIMPVPDILPVPDEILEHYDSDREISFIMNSATRFVRIPADMVWVRTIDFNESRVTPAPDGTFTVDGDRFIWVINPAELKKLCGDGSRKIPVKVTIRNARTGKDKIMHLTDLQMQFRPNGSADISAHGYVFDK